MSMENNAPERGAGKNEEMYDSEGAPRQSWVLQPDDEVFFGSEREMLLRKKEKLEEIKNK